MKTQGIHQITTPSFSALRIPKKNGLNNLSVLGKKNFGMLDYVGELIKDTKFYHMYIERDIYIRNVHGRRFDGPYTVQRAGKCLVIGYKNGYEQIRVKVPFNTETASLNAQNDISSSSTQIERTAKIIKYLDDYEKKLSEQKPNVIINEKDSYNDKLEKLMTKYGV